MMIVSLSTAFPPYVTARLVLAQSTPLVLMKCIVLHYTNKVK
nr:MAG TPA: hypothetical protein [Caudoviricetes sp.]